MKKLLSIILTVCMLFSLVIVPININAVEDEKAAYQASTLGSYYKFTFDSEEDVYDYTVNEKATYKGKEFIPFWGSERSGKSTAQYKEITSPDGETYKVLEVIPVDSHINLTFLTKEGKPYELTPGKNYTVKINYFNPVATLYNQSYLCMGNNEGLYNKNIELYPGHIRSSTYSFENEKLTYDGGSGVLAFGFKDGTYGKSAEYSNMANLVNGCSHKSDEDKRYETTGKFTCTHGAGSGYNVYREVTTTYQLLENYYTYDTETKTYTANMPVYTHNNMYYKENGVQIGAAGVKYTLLTEKPAGWETYWKNFYQLNGEKYEKLGGSTAPEFEADKYYFAGLKTDETVAVNNYLSVALAGVYLGNYIGSNKPLYTNYTYDELTDKNNIVYSRYLIESVEVFEELEVTYKDENGTVLKTQTAKYGDAYSFPKNLNASVANIDYDYVWSLSNTEYIPVGDKIEKDVTVYEYKNPVISFENYKANLVTVDIPEQNSVVTTLDAYTGTHSILFTNSNVMKQDTEPDDWATTYTKYFYYDSTARKYVNFAAADEAPAFEAGKVFTAMAADHLRAGLTTIHYIGKVTEQLNPDKTEFYFAEPEIGYKVTFKYRATENNTTTSKIQLRTVTYDNIYWGNNAGGTIVSADEFVIPAGPTDGWQTGTITFADNGNIRAVNKAPFALDLRFLGDKNTRNTNEIFVDDVRVEKVGVITFVDHKGNKSSTVAENGVKINYPTNHPYSATNYNDHYVWSKSMDEYIPAPIYSDGTTTTYYQMKSDVASFQHNIPETSMFKPDIPSVQYYDEGALDHRSMRIRNYGVTLAASKPADWATKYKDYMYYNNENNIDTYCNITDAMYNSVNGDYDEFVKKYGSVYNNRKNGANPEQVNVPVFAFNNADANLNKNVKITFKYKFLSNSTQNGVKASIFVGNTNNIWNSYYKELPEQYVYIPYSDSDEWQTATLYSVIKDVNVGDKKAAVCLNIIDAVNPKNQHTFTILVDDVKVEDFDGVDLGAEPTKIADSVVDGHTYKLTYKYNANSDHTGFSINLSTGDPNQRLIPYESCGATVVEAGNATNGYTKVTHYFTAQTYKSITDESEAGIDYKYQDLTCALYATLGNGSDSNVDFIDFELVDLGVAVTAQGASILTDAAAESVHQQAMRYYFNYKTNDGSQIIIGDETFKVVKRGFLYANGNADKNVDGVISSDEATFHNLTTSSVDEFKVTDFDKCWAYNSDTKMMTYSTYVTGFQKQNDARKLEVRGYIVIEVDGQQFTLFADTSINRTVDGTKGKTDGVDPDTDFEAGKME